jgi:hypothetical protein
MVSSEFGNTDDNLFYENNIVALAWRAHEKRFRTDVIQIWSRTSNWKLRNLYHSAQLLNHKNEYNKSFAQAKDPKDCANFRMKKAEGEDIFLLDLKLSIIMRVKDK